MCCWGSGDNELPGLTDTEKPRMRGPKRATKIRKLFSLSKEDDVRKCISIYRRKFESATGTWDDIYKTGLGRAGLGWAGLRFSETALVVPKRQVGMGREAGGQTWTGLVVRG